MTYLSIIIFVFIELLLIGVGILGWLKYHKFIQKISREKELENDYWSLVPEDEEGLEGVEG